ncbi:site-specific integrase [Kaistia terrae]|uniref:Tyrosine-type recombinase/integrase n=1 Tax=Kaistia terrae TaxID=537017 RepID=A0ABW0Q3G3_9HYPH|nr:site-specific integrase [Kaistia terrae]MCX5581201.1 site-specific integrase [Kaistia terrae]
MRLTKRVIDDLAVSPGEREIFLWDDAVTGYGVRVSPTGRKVLLVRYRIGSRQRFLSLGPLGSPYTVETGRDRARSILRAVAEGDDPQSKKMEQRREMTVGELIDQYLSVGPTDKPSKRQSSWVTDASNLNRHIRPLVGGRLVSEMSSAHVSKLRADIERGRTAVDEKTGYRGRAIVRGGAGVSNRAINVFQAMLTWALKHELVSSNPAKGVARTKTQRLERFLSEAESGQLLVTLDALEAEGRVHSVYSAIIRLLLFTGARRSEIVDLKWSEIDFDRCYILLAPARHKTGAKTGSKRIALAPSALEIVGSQPRVSDFVFPAFRGVGRLDAPTSGLGKAWDRVREAANLAGVRLHDLRHTFASFGVSTGETLYSMGKAMGHSSGTMTERYAHLADDPIRAAVGRTVTAIERTRSNNEH